MHPDDCSINTLYGPLVLQTLIRANFSQLDTTGGRFICSGKMWCLHSLSSSAVMSERRMGKCFRLLGSKRGCHRTRFVYFSRRCKKEMFVNNKLLHLQWLPRTSEKLCPLWFQWRYSCSYICQDVFQFQRRFLKLLFSLALAASSLDTLFTPIIVLLLISCLVSQ
jgi:hypothetical protein